MKRHFLIVGHIMAMFALIITALLQVELFATQVVNNSDDEMGLILASGFAIIGSIMLELVVIFYAVSQIYKLIKKKE